MAIRIEKAFGVDMETLMRMQNSCDIARAHKRESSIRVPRYEGAAHARAAIAERRRQQQGDRAGQPVRQSHILPRRSGSARARGLVRKADLKAQSQPVLVLLLRRIPSPSEKCSQSGAIPLSQVA
jgi:hypothetical protein